MNNFSTILRTKLFNNTFEIITFLILVTSVVWLKEINYLFYNSLESPDFDKYSIYFEHFFNGAKTNKEHGLLYYYLHSFNYSLFYAEFLSHDINLDKSIQQVNFYIYLIGLIGYYVLLRFHKFSNKIIFAVLTFVNFFPPSISMRLVFKPEILAFAFLPWIIYLLEKFKSENNLKYLYLSIPLILSLITQKGNILVTTAAILFFLYFKSFIKIRIKHLFLIVGLGLFSFFALSFENSNANGKNLLDIQSGSAIEENYNFKAPYSIIYKVDMFNLISKPEKHNHANSFIGITLLETNGDYFDLIWNNDASNYFSNRKIIFKTEISKEIKIPKYNKEDTSLTIYKQRDSDRFPRKSLGLIISILFYFYLIKSYFDNKKFRPYFTIVFIGMGTLLFHSITGFPKNNFDPSVGDTFKPMYYSFAMIFSFVFLIANYLKNHMWRYSSIIIYCLTIVFILGFPKSYNYEIQANLVPKIQQSVYCEIEKNHYLGNSDFKDVSCGKETELLKKDETSNNLKHKPINLFFIISNLSVMTYILLENKGLSFLKLSFPHKRKNNKQ